MGQVEATILAAAVGGLCGVLGAIVGQWVAFRYERKRWERESKYRWIQEKRRVYSEFLAAGASLLVDMSMILERDRQLRATGGQMTERDKEFASRADVRVVQSVHNINKSLAELRLVGDSDAVAKGVAFGEAAMALSRDMAFEKRRDEEKFQAVDRLKDEFVESVRRDLES